MQDDLLTLPLAALTARYRAGSLSPVEATQRHLARIDALEPRLNAFQIVDPAGALAMARASEARWRAATPLGPLDGVPVTIKDNVDIAGHPTRNGSLTTPATPAAADSPAVARLREAGAVFLGKTTLPEFGWKGITDSRLRGVATRNPWNFARSPGGSTGGGAAALAAGIGTLAFGNDGGGSIRIPACFTGLFGIKPNFGRVPHHPLEGVFATVVSDGPLARSAVDAAAMLAVLARPDDRDWYAAPPPPDGWLDGLTPRLAGLRLAYAPELGGAQPDAQVRARIDATIATLQANGAVIENVGPVIDPLKPAFEPFWLASFAYRLRTIPRERWDEIDPGYVRIAQQGMAIGLEPVLAAAAFRAQLYRRFAELFRRHDLLLTPTTPHAAPPADTVYHTQGYDRWRDAIPYTLPFNLTGLPAVSLPCGLTAEGLPVGLQVVGPKFAERAILEACLAIETLLGFGRVRDRAMAAL
jgi:aspartyl-tRNA(Asn)/glutamyl-tRNA(Gln) amidotransferase subunit A